ncbi:MAG: hypothetical protein JWR07_1901 [Nevskia sp.]|nr:hypothetical protein [Nevskia sp.]
MAGVNNFTDPVTGATFTNTSGQPSIVSGATGVAPPQQLQQAGPSDAQILDFFYQNKGNPAAVAQAMQQYGVNGDRFTQVTGQPISYFSQPAPAPQASAAAPAPASSSDPMQGVKDYFAAHPDALQYTDPATGQRFSPTYSGGGFDGQGSAVQGTLVGYSSDSRQPGQSWQPGDQFTMYDASGNKTGTGTEENPYSDSTIEVIAKLGIAAMVGGAAYSAYGAAGSSSGAMFGSGDVAGSIVNGETLETMSQAAMEAYGGDAAATAAQQAAIEQMAQQALVPPGVMPPGSTPPSAPGPVTPGAPGPGVPPVVPSSVTKAATSLIPGIPNSALIPAATTLLNGAATSNAATSAANQTAAGAGQAASILSPAQIAAAKLQSDAATSAGNILSNSALSAGKMQADASTAAGNRLSTAYGTATTDRVAGLTDALGTTKGVLAQQTANQQPYMMAGTQALAELSKDLQPGGKFNTTFTMADAQNMPAYQFAKDEGLSTMNNAAAAGGMQLSSANIRNLTQFAEGNAAQYEQQAFNQWLQQNNLTLGALQNMVNTGQVSTQQLQGALAQYGVSASTIQDAIGTAQASGALGSAQALNTGQTDAAKYLAGGTTGSGNALAAGTVGSAGYTAQGITGSANALANGTVAQANANAAGTVANSNIISSGINAVGNILDKAFTPTPTATTTAPAPASVAAPAPAPMTTPEQSLINPYPMYT